MKKIKNKGILFWITGFSGSGKTQIAKKISKQISKHFGLVETCLPICMILRTRSAVPKTF